MELRDSHIFERQPEGHYVEPLDLDRAIIKKLGPPKKAKILDPCCGFGRIVRAAREAGFEADGTDIMARWENSPDGPMPEGSTMGIVDYLKVPAPKIYDGIIMNPPYGQTVEFVEKALGESQQIVAAIVPATWINGARTARWLAGTPWVYYWPISPRPSMPPGEYLQRGEVAGGGTKDFAVLVWVTQPGIFNGNTLVKHLFWKE